MNNIYETLVRMAISFPTWTFEEGFGNGQRRMVFNVKKLLNELKVLPIQLVDCGANNSDWARAMLHWFPNMELVSIEPLPTDQTIRKGLHEIALSDQEGLVPIEYLGKRGTVSVKRFDQLKIEIKRPALLKVDCEDYTYRALKGFGYELTHFAVVVVEMWNGINSLKNPKGVPVDLPNQQADIWNLMTYLGFRMARVVDVPYYRDNIYVYDIAFYKP